MEKSKLAATIKDLLRKKGPMTCDQLAYNINTDENIQNKYGVNSNEVRWMFEHHADLRRTVQREITLSWRCRNRIYRYRVRQ